MRLTLLFLALASGSVQAALDTAPLESWLARQSKITSLHADFIQERTLPALKKPVKTPGSLWMQRPGKLRWELGSPVKTLAISDGTTMTLLDVEKKEARQMPADSARAKQFTLLADGALSGDLSGFLEAFELVESTTTNGIYQLTTKPKDRRIRSRVPWVYLDIDPRKNELLAMSVRLADKSLIRTIFSKSRFDSKPPTSKFIPNLSGYTIK